MAVIAPTRPKSRREPGSGTGGPGGGRPAEGGGGGDPRRPDAGGDRRYHTGMWVALGGIVMLFTAFTSAYVVRKGLSDDWEPFAMPPLVWLNTAVLLASGFSLEKARRAFPSIDALGRWWWTATALGAAFLAGQILLWNQLVAAGVYLSGNPSSSFFYVLTGAHGVHLLGGLAALIWLGWKLRAGRLTRTAADVMAIYWHFMDGLWIYLLLLLLIWR